jgi:ABC-type ATPase involved in cell division
LQRIFIARALLTDPALLIVDELVLMVDASLRMSFINLFNNIRDELGVSNLLSQLPGDGRLCQRPYRHYVPLKGATRGQNIS